MILTIFVIFSIFSIIFLFWKYPAISISRKSLICKSNQIFINDIFYYIVPVFLISLLIGLRYDVGVDYLAYKEIYETHFTGALNESYKNIEFLFGIISFCCYKLGIPYYFFFVLMAFIPFIFYYKAFKSFSYLFPFVSYCLISLGVLFWYFNIQRQTTAFFILLYSVNFIKENKKIKFLLCCLLAFGFHASSIYFIPCFLLYYFPNRQIISSCYLIIIYIFTWVFSDQLQFLLFEMITPFLSGRYADYLVVMDNWNMEGGTGLGLLTLHLIDFILIIKSPLLFIYHGKERFDIYFRIYFIGALISNIAGVNMLLSRLPFCFVSMRIIIAAFFLYYVSSTWKKQSYITKSSFVILTIFTIMLLIANIINTPYSFVFM